jgi:RNA polymerase sigma-70 factor (ECF subfamily)
LFFRKKIAFKENDIESIISACLANNHLAQKALIKLFFGFAKNIGLPYVDNEQEVDEIINDGFLKVFNNLSKYDHSKPFKIWFKAIIINAAIDYYRKNKKHANQVSIDYIEIINEDEDIISKISAQEILNLVQKLPPTYRMVFSLYVIDGYNHREIGEMLGIQEGTSKSNLQDARKKLQLMIKKNYPHLYLAYSLQTNKINEN